jgi:polar amino acid transport system permease protein
VEGRKLGQGFDISLVIKYLPDFWRGTLATMWISGTSLTLALLIGLIVGLGRVSPLSAPRWLARVYTDIIRGTPALMQIFFIYFGLPSVGIRLSAPVAGVLALGINSGAYISEIIRAAIQSIERGQMEAARGLGMNYRQAMRRIILPQTVRRSIPPITGELISLVKGSSLLSVISIGELTRVGTQILGVTFRPLEAYLPVAAIYLLLNVGLTQLTILIEARASKYE